MAGVLCAYMLQQAGIPYVLAEAQSICSGITKNTTAKITVQHSLIYDKLIRKFGVEKARQYLEANESALCKYRELGRRIGRSKPVISNYENNIKYPPLEVLISIANVFNVSLDYLVGIEKKDALYINNLNETQTNIMKLLYEEFTDCNLKGKELSSRQQKILSLLLIEFLK